MDQSNDYLKTILHNHRYRDVVHFDEIDGVKYTKQDLRRVKPPYHHEPSQQLFSTLNGLLGFVHTEASSDHAIIHVTSPTKVILIGDIEPDNDNQRFTYAAARCAQDYFQFGRFMDIEQFIINLMSQFAPTQNINDIITMLGRVASQFVKENVDDGFSQTLQVKLGITTRENVTVENPMLLQPWRTFREVAQPESQCLLRLRSGRGDDAPMQAAIFEADGGAWQLEAMANIRTFLQSGIKDIGLDIPVLA